MRAISLIYNKHHAHAERRPIPAIGEHQTRPLRSGHACSAAFPAWPCRRRALPDQQRPSNRLRSLARPSPTRSKKARTRAVALRSACVTIQSSPMSSGTGV